MSIKRKTPGEIRFYAFLSVFGLSIVISIFTLIYSVNKINQLESTIKEMQNTMNTYHNEFVEFIELQDEFNQQIVGANNK